MSGALRLTVDVAPDTTTAVSRLTPAWQGQRHEAQVQVSDGAGQRRTVKADLPWKDLG